MGTRIELHQFGPGDADALAHARRAIEAVDDALTIHRPSPATALNDCLAAVEAATVDDPVLFDALLGIEDACAITEGLFDPAVHAGEPGGRWRTITIDRRTRRVAAAGPTALDFGGFGKGYALDRACAVLRAGGVTSAFLSAGESSIAVIGRHPVDGLWSLAVPHPLAADEWLVTLELEDAAVSISSTVGATAPGRSPMVRPADGAIVSAAVTTVAVEKTGALAEAVSTALLVADDEGAQRLLAPRPGHRYRFTFTSEATGSSGLTGSFA